MKDAFFHKTMFWLVLTMGLISVVGMSLSGISVQPQQLLTKGALYGAILLGAWFYHKRGASRLVCPLLIVFWLGLFSDLHIFPMFVAGRQGVPFQDHLLASFDRWLGIETPEVMAALARVPWLQSLLHHSYGTLVFLLTAAVLLPSLLNRMQAAKELLISCVLAVLLCFPIFAVFQAHGPWVYYGYEPSVNQDAYMSVFASLKQAPHFVMDLRYRNGLICFPSFHTILAVLAGVALWAIPIARWLGVTWSTLIVTSTVTTGTHYLVDVLAGLAVVALSVTGAKLWSRWESKRNQQQEEANGDVKQSHRDRSTSPCGSKRQVRSAVHSPSDSSHAVG